MTRADAREGHLHRVIVWMIYFLAAMLAFLILGVVVSLLFEGLWLDKAGREEITDLLLTGGVGAGLASLANNYLFTNDKPDA